MMVHLKRAALSALCLLVMFAVCACSNPERLERLSDQEVGRLRGEYPYCSEPSFDYEPVYHLSDLNNIAAAVVVTVTDEWYSNEYNISPFDEDVNWAENTTVGWFLPVHVDEVLWATDDWSGAEQIDLYFYSAISFSDYHVFQEGKQYLCLIGTLKDTVLFEGETDTIYAGSPFCSFYITDQNYLMAMSTLPATDQYSGYHFDLFCTQVATAMETEDK